MLQPCLRHGPGHGSREEKMQSEHIRARAHKQGPLCGPFMQGTSTCQIPSGLFHLPSVGNFDYQIRFPRCLISSYPEASVDLLDESPSRAERSQPAGNNRHCNPVFSLPSRWNGVLLASLSAARAPPLRKSRSLPRWELAPCTINRRLRPVDIVPQEASEKSCGPESFRTAARYYVATAVVLMQSPRNTAVLRRKRWQSFCCRGSARPAGG